MDKRGQRHRMILYVYIMCVCVYKYTKENRNYRNGAVFALGLQSLRGDWDTGSTLLTNPHN